MFGVYRKIKKQLFMHVIVVIIIKECIICLYVTVMIIVNVLELCPVN